MRKPAKSNLKTSRKRPQAAAAPSPRIHPVIIYPFRQPSDHADLKALYTLVQRLDSNRKTYARPITIVDCKTRNALALDPGAQQFFDRTVTRCSDVEQAWCVDTCQMWYTGLGRAFQQGSPQDVYWLIPGDFNYGTSTGQAVLDRLHDLPEIILDLDQDICVGEIATDHNHPKQLIDTYGTFALLYNWFPAEAQEIRQFTERPRSEFFAVRHSFLREALQRRWYPYEQTVVLLLQATFGGGRISRFFVGDICDLPEGREPLSSAIQQVERTERVLKSLWRERNQEQPGWVEAYRLLEDRSESCRRTALTILQNLFPS